MMSEFIMSYGRFSIIFFCYLGNECSDVVSVIFWKIEFKSFKEFV